MEFKNIKLGKLALLAALCATLAAARLQIFSPEKLAK